jgi:hypothetical protein
LAPRPAPRAVVAWGASAQSARASGPDEPVILGEREPRFGGSRLGPRGPRERATGCTLQADRAPPNVPNVPSSARAPAAAAAQLLADVKRSAGRPDSGRHWPGGPRPSPRSLGGVRQTVRDLMSRSPWASARPASRGRCRLGSRGPCRPRERATFKRPARRSAGQTQQGACAGSMRLNAADAAWGWQVGWGRGCTLVGWGRGYMWWMG